MPYTIADHSHRLAAWAASTAAGASSLCRFKVETGAAILSECGFNAQFTLASLPEPEEIDETHLCWREMVIASSLRKELPFTHGVAAKLINCYLKVRFVCGGQYMDPGVAALHPPIDRVLLSNLARENIGGVSAQWTQYCKIGWSNFCSGTYQEVVNLIREALGPGIPLWMIEEYWGGHQ